MWNQNALKTADKQLTIIPNDININCIDFYSFSRSFVRFFFLKLTLSNCKDFSSRSKEARSVFDVICEMKLVEIESHSRSLTIKHVRKSILIALPCSLVIVVILLLLLLWNLISNTLQHWRFAVKKKEANGIVKEMWVWMSKGKKKG